MNKKFIKKISGKSSAHVLYEGPDGEVVTSTEIAKGNVKSKPSSWKPKSLSDIVNSPEFGSNIRGVKKKKNKKAGGANNIKKISYDSGAKNVMTSGPRPLSSGRDSHTETGGFGYILNDIRSGDFDLENYSKDGDVKLDNISLNDLLDLIDCLVDIANSMDEESHHKEADFFDYMIKVSKRASDIDYSKSFNDIVSAISMGEDSNSLIIKTVKTFSKDINNYMNSNKDSNINDAKKYAYDNILKSLEGSFFEQV